MRRSSFCLFLFVVVLLVHVNTVAADCTDEQTAYRQAYETWQDAKRTAAQRERERDACVASKTSGTACPAEQSSYDSAHAAISVHALCLDRAYATLSACIDQEDEEARRAAKRTEEAAGASTEPSAWELLLDWWNSQREG